MFKTLKIPIQLNPEDKLYIEDLQRQYSIVVRYSYNRWIEGYSEKSIRLAVKSLKNIDSLNSWLVQCAILDAKAIFTRFNYDKKEKSIISKQIFFGGNKLLNRLHRKLITDYKFI